MPLSVHSIRERVEAFLCANALRPDTYDHYLAVLDAEERIVAGGGLSGDVVKGVAVADELRSEGITNTLISHLLSLAASAGYASVKVFTKPENRRIFESLGFHVLAEAPKALLLENGRGLEAYVRELAALPRTGRVGAVVMHANPCTLGHRYLMEQALQQVDTLCVIPVREERSAFPYAERLAMLRAVAATFGGRVVVAEGSAYQISAATFPTYFLKDLSDAAETQMRLDIHLFAQHIAPALGASVRFVGSEPLDPLTARYNALMQELLPPQGISVMEVPRISSVIPSEAKESLPLSASAVRAALAEGDYRSAAALTPPTTHPYLLASLAERALTLELETPLKPGLVCPESPGAHRDMDAATMRKGIAAIRPFFPAMATAATADELRQLGLDAEAAMLAATGGVNTHRGAIYAIGLALNACGRYPELPDISEAISRMARCILDHTPQTDGPQAASVAARRIALGGYRPLFEDWLPYYRSQVGQEPLSEALARTGTPSDAHVYARQKTLLRIMSTLDDSCVTRRAGAARAEAVKAEAAELSGLLAHPGQKDLLKTLCERYAAEGISPGGAADMLALTLFFDSILINQ